MGGWELIVTGFKRPPASRGMIYKHFESKYITLKKSKMREFVSLPDVGSETTISFETNPF